MAKGLPEILTPAYTLNGRIPLKYRVLEDDRPEIQAQIRENFKESTFLKYMKMAHRREPHYYGTTDRWLYEALEARPIEGLDVCIFGSANPWYEAVAVTFGARSCVVVEWSDRPSFHPKIQYIKPEKVRGMLFDAGISISSFEHYGLGRYGDPLDPDGDLKAMEEARTVLKEGAALFLSVPVGQDLMCFNSHRVYGNVRYPMLVAGWRSVADYGVGEDSFHSTVNEIHTPYQPVFVLEEQ